MTTSEGRLFTQAFDTMEGFNVFGCHIGMDSGVFFGGLGWLMMIIGFWGELINRKQFGKDFHRVLVLDRICHLDILRIVPSRLSLFHAGSSMLLFLNFRLSFEIGYHMLPFK